MTRRRSRSRRKRAQRQIARSHSRRAELEFAPRTLTGAGALTATAVARSAALAPPAHLAGHSWRGARRMFSAHRAATYSGCGILTASLTTFGEDGVDALSSGVRPAKASTPITLAELAVDDDADLDDDDLDGEDAATSRLPFVLVEYSATGSADHDPTSSPISPDVIAHYFATETDAAIRAMALREQGIEVKKVIDIRTVKKPRPDLGSLHAEARAGEIRRKRAAERARRGAGGTVVQPPAPDPDPKPAHGPTGLDWPGAISRLHRLLTDMYGTDDAPTVTSNGHRAAGREPIPR